ncbi:MAG TPA: hypothetical protein VNS09_03615 [Solirubrobacter sp.]|nr:hypothetical protein [Solirubrobacter sp.]
MPAPHNPGRDAADATGSVQRWTCPSDASLDVLAAGGQLGLSQADWCGVLTLHEDLLVYANHADGACVASARRVNPSEFVERWVARGWLSLA